MCALASPYGRHVCACITPRASRKGAAPGSHVRGRSRDIYGAGVGHGLAWDTSPPRRDESRGYAFTPFRHFHP